ncbi:MAG: hypothetical protein J3K34DRAFT_408214 [Monoraphidium minutum]|nr:MAG: hypothetical protein J3K34DRAFT_408214 [Monoraphidium minutum]
MRRIPHPGDAPETALAAAAEAAAAQQLAIGKREAREQAAALAAASAEIRRWKAAAADALAAKARLAERTKELRVQRDESMGINKQLLAGYRQVEGELEAATARARDTEREYLGLRQQLLDAREAAEGAAAGGGGGGEGRPWWSVLPLVGGGANKDGGGADALGTENPVQQLLRFSQQLARGAEMDDTKREQIKARMAGAVDDGDGSWGDAGGGSWEDDQEGAGAGSAAANGAAAVPSANLSEDEEPYFDRNNGGR